MAISPRSTKKKTVEASIIAVANQNEIPTKSVGAKYTLLIAVS
jgi:hypothetical protein